MKEADSVLTQLMEIARELEAQHPELFRLVMEYEAATTLESGLAAEIVYREGIRRTNPRRRAPCDESAGSKGAATCAAGNKKSRPQW